MQGKVSIILLNYNTTQDTIDCIESLSQIDYSNYNIIIVDNESREEEYKKLEKYTDDRENCILMKSGHNGGFAYGNNIGINYAKNENADYILLLNCDTEVEKDFLTKLVNAIEENKEENIIAIGKINYFYDKKKIWYGGGKIDWDNYTGVHYGEGETDRGQYDEQKEITFATGCTMLINASINTEITLPEEYFMYYEDVDFCARLIGEGYKILYVPKAVIYHKVGASGGGEASPFTLRWANRGRLIFMNKYKKNTSVAKFSAIKSKFYITRIIKYILLLCKGDFKKAMSIYHGTIDGVKYNKLVQEK